MVALGSAQPVGLNAVTGRQWQSFVMAVSNQIRPGWVSPLPNSDSFAHYAVALFEGDAWTGPHDLCAGSEAVHLCHKSLGAKHLWVVF